MEYRLRSASLSSYVEFARECGLDPEAELEAVGLDPADLGDPENLIPTTSVRALLDASARHSKLDDFGLRLAQRRKPSNLGLIGLLVREEPTVRAALSTIHRYLKLHQQDLQVNLRDFGDAGLLEFGFLLPGGPGRQGAEMVLASFVHIIGNVVGRQVTPDCTYFIHPRPRSTAIHREIFGPNLQFGQQVYGLLLPKELLNTPRPRGSAASTAWLRARLDQMVKNKPSDPVTTAEQVVSDLLPTGQCSAESVAAALNMSSRSLRRKLADQRLSFNALVDRARRNLVADYLEDPRRSIGEVSELLGFSQQSIFSRWHRARFGASPRAARPKTTARQPDRTELVD